MAIYVVVHYFLYLCFFSESDLAVGEMTCVDRCVGKYMEAQEKVSEVKYFLQTNYLVNTEINSPFSDIRF